MIESIVAGAVLVAGVVGASKRGPGRGRATSPGNSHPGSAPMTLDLPCPWCRAATSESDTECITCGQRFGYAGPGA